MRHWNPKNGRYLVVEARYRATVNRLRGHDAIAGKLEKLIGETVAIALLHHRHQK